jgi:Fe-S-cluster containining protein
MSEDQDLAAGDFSSWIDDVQGAIRGEHGSDVPCDSCTACCTSSQFIHIEPDETDTLEHVPTALLFPAPRLPHGHVVLGYDERGHCPMLADNRCSIYEHRPRTCRTYDCRVFPAAGLGVDESGKESIDRQARRWQFSYQSEVDHIRHEAVQAAAAFLGRHPDVLSGDRAVTTTQLAIAAIRIHDVFLDQRSVVDSGQSPEPAPAAVRVELARRSRGRGAS